MADFDPMQPVGGSPLPPSPISADEIAEMRARSSDARYNDLSKSAVLRLLDAIEALSADNARLTSERDELAGKLGKYAMPPWEADACKREAMAARRALCLGEHSQNVAPADIYDRIVALRTANETSREDVR